MSAQPRSRVLLRRLARPMLALCATLLTLLAGEGIVRLLRLAPAIKPIEIDSYECFYERSTNPILGFELKANCRSDRPDFIQTYERTNSHGQRDRPRALKKPEAVRRVLLLGDSVVEGYGLREADTISRRLEDLYADGSTEVLNFGVSAYCTRAEVELLEVKGLQFDPDVVVLVFVENDFDNFNREAFPLAGAVDRPAVVKELFQASHLFRLTALALNLFQFAAEADPARWNQEAIGENNVADGLRRFRALADQHGFQPLVAIWPRFLDDCVADVCFLPDDNERLVVEHLAAMVGIPAFRLSAFFQQHQQASPGKLNPRLRYSQGDELHPSAEGSRIAAQALQQILTDLDAGRAPVANNTSRSSEADAQALASARALGRTQPNYARVHNRIGTELLHAGRPAEAAARFEQALQEDPTYAGACNNLGVACERLGRSDAQNHFERAVQVQPDFVPARFNLARLLMQKGRIAESLLQLQHTIRIDPNHVGALNMLGMALGRQQKFAEARSYLERAVRLDPNHAEARSNLGAAYAGLGLLPEAVAQFEAALRIDPQDPGALENLKRVKAALSQ